MINEIGRLKKIIEGIRTQGIKIYDDFNDNFQNTNIWDTYVTGGTTAVAETGGELKISNAGGGGDTAGYSHAPTVKKFGKSLIIEAQIGVTDGEAGGDGQRCEAYIELYKDADNYFQFGLYRDTSEGINSRGYVHHKISPAAEVTDDVDVTNIDNIARRYIIIVDEHNIHVYLDSESNLLATYAFEGLTDYTIRLVAGAELNADTIDIRFDDFSITPYYERIRALQSKLLSIQGGSESLQTLHDDHLEPILDVARSGDSGTTVMDGNELTLYEESSTTAMEFDGGYIDWTALNAGAGEDTTVKVYIKIKSGGTYREIYNEIFLAAALPSPICTPVPRESTSQPAPSRLYNVYGVKVTATQAALGGGWNTLEHEWFDAKS